MEIKSPCRSDRVPALIPIQVSWTGRRGEHFDEMAKTLTVRRNAATIVLARKLLPNQEITVHCAQTKKFAPARVVGLIGQESAGHIYGVAFIDPDVSLWDIELPPVADSKSATSSFFLECACCLTRARIDLDDIQAEVFEAQRIITLFCKQCSSWTVWGLASHDSSSKSDGMGTLKLAPAPRTQNDRKHARVLMNMNACVRHAGLVEEVVRVKDVSRGGFRFVSPNYHPDGTEIMVAMPYTRDASNVFVPARIVWRREVRRLERFEYGVTYSKSPERLRAR